MLVSKALRGLSLVGLLAVALAIVAIAQSVPAWSAQPGLPGTVTSPKNGSVGFTVSWLPTTSPVLANPGQEAQGKFWVTNQTTAPIPVEVLPGTAVPGNNGSLEVQNGPDNRFPNIAYSPNTFTAQPKATDLVTVTITVPQTLGPGVYLVPAIVRPAPPKSGGNIQIRQETDALVTFQVPGATNAHLKASFLGSVPGPGSPTTHHLPGFPGIQIGTSASEIFRVTNDSPASFYAYNELTATQTPFGTVVFQGHTVGDSHDLRNDPALYFPNLHRDYPVTWHPSILGLGTAHIVGFVSYHPNSSVVAQAVARTQVLVISPLWTLAVIACLAALVALARRRTQRQAKQTSGMARSQRNVISRVAQIVGSLVLMLGVLVGAFLSRPLVFAAVAGAGVIGAGLIVAYGTRIGRLTSAKWIGWYEFTIGIVLLVGVGAVVLSTLSTRSADIAVAIVSGGGLWVLLAWWIQWWNEERSESQRSRPNGSDAGDDRIPAHI